MKCLSCDAAELTLPEAEHAWICPKCKCAFNVKAVKEIERLRVLVIAVATADFGSGELHDAVCKVGEYAHGELGITESAKEQPDD